jgi:cytochrome c-type biogenesis protein CcmH/NrfF
MKTRMLALLLTILVVMSLVTACSSGSSSSTTATSTTSKDGSTLLQERCTVCHNLSRVESSRHTSADWKTIVDRMIGKGAQLTSDEETLVVDYLAATYGK